MKIKKRASFITHMETHLGQLALAALIKVHEVGVRLKKGARLLACRYTSGEMSDSKSYKSGLQKWEIQNHAKMS